MAVKCQKIAIDAERIINKKDVVPWPHPKNIRFVIVSYSSIMYIHKLYTVQ